jgi:hypothetical protein
MRLIVGRPAADGGGRHGAVQAISVAAGRLGTAYWSGRRTAADDLGDSITAAAGLPPLPVRERVITGRTAGILAAAGLVILVLAAGASGLAPASGGLATLGQGVARVLSFAGTVFLLPGVGLAIDRLAARTGQNSRSTPSSMPRIES